MKLSKVDFSRMVEIKGNQSDPYGWSGSIDVNRAMDIYYVRWEDSPTIRYSNGKELIEIGEARFSAEFAKVCHDHYMKNQPY